MARKGKWIAGTSADQPASEAARRTLEARLAAVWHYLPLAAQYGEQSAEHVHQLRVASRRAVAAVAILEPLLPRRRARWLRKRLKEVRRAAGAARDDDVLILRLERWAKRYPAVQPMLKQLRRHRRESQEPIRQVHRRLVKEGFPREVDQLLRRIRWRGRGREPCFATMAREQLQQCLEQFESAAAGDFNDLDALHRFRIAGKQLRYTMEIFAPAFPPSFRERQYATVERLQELLGQVNDHATVAARLRRWQEEADDVPLQHALQRLLAAEQRAVNRSRKAFLDWWTPARARSLSKSLSRLATTDDEGHCQTLSQ